MNPPTSYGIREARENFSAVIKRVAQGESIPITSHGKVVAVMSPPGPDPEPFLSDLVSQGKMIPATRSFNDLNLPKFKGSRPSLEILNELNEDNI